MTQFSSPFVYLHTVRLIESLLEDAIDARVPVEIDISLDEDTLYVGHPDEWHEYHGSERPNLISIDTLVPLLVAVNQPYVIDLKDKDAYIQTKQLIQAIGAERCVVHVFAESLAFDTFETVVEPHRQQEDIPDAIIKDLKLELGVFVMVSARGMQKVEDDEVIKVLEGIVSWIDAFNGGIDYASYTPKLREFLAGNDIRTLRHASNVIEPAPTDIVAVDDLSVARAIINGTL